MPCHAHVHAHVKKAWCHKKAVRCRRNDRRFAAGMACLCYGIPQHLHQMAASPFHSQFGGDSPPPNGDALNAFYRNGGCLWVFLHWRMIQDLSQGAVNTASNATSSSSLSTCGKVKLCTIDVMPCLLCVPTRNH